MKKKSPKVSQIIRASPNKPRSTYSEHYARGLDPRPTEDELAEAIDLLQQHKMYAAVFALMEVEAAEHG